MSSLEYILNHPRKTSVAAVYPIGTVVDDLEVVEYSSVRNGTALLCSRMEIPIFDGVRRR